MKTFALAVLFLVGCGSASNATGSQDVTDAGATEGTAYCAALMACPDSGVMECLPERGGSCPAEQLQSCLDAILVASCASLGDVARSADCKACAALP